MKSAGSALERLFEAFVIIGELQPCFEGEEAKHRMRRASFEPTPVELRDPFIPRAFFGEIVLTSARAGEHACAAAKAPCVFYSGVVVRAFGEGVVAPRQPGRPELQVGIAMVTGKHWRAGDDRDLEDLRSALGPEWTIDRSARGGGRTALCLAARQDALRVIEQCEYDRAKLRGARSAFFGKRWAELARAPDAGFEWLKRNA